MAFLVQCTCRKLLSLSSSLSRTPSKNQLLTSRLSHLLNKGVRTLHTGYIYSSSSESSDGSDDPKTNDDEGSLDEVDLGSLSRAIATISIPDTLPEVPLLVLNRNPMFPRFVKMVEVTDKSLMSLIKQKCDLALPYAGAFLKKNDKYIIL
uniref:Lon N-terminal domain-containing protein n=1 Tax=Amphimedon queenslandica TaxID=400682 RepID=A0A1X7TQM7_AMPQE